MAKYRHWKIITILFKIVIGISASTHWVVTENGKIQSQLDSAFHMRRPYDLISLLEQEHRAAEIDRLFGQMVQRKARIDTEWAGLESATELETRLYTTDPDCLQAGRPLSDLDLYISVASDGNGREGIDMDELLPASASADVPEQPDCSAALDLPFSMRTFPHLQVLSWNLTTAPELLLGVSDVAGRQIAAGLQHNRTSWFLHNLAALYWRSHGDAWRALQCAKRAAYLSPRQYKDISLLNLGCLVHQARCPAEAAILLHAAVDHAPHVASSHLALANVYAILGDYNRSIACYDNALKLQPHWTAAERNRFAVICHHKLENSLYQLHRSLQDILSQLHEYHSLQEQWLKHQEQLMYQQAPLEVKLQGFQNEPLSSLLSHKGENCLPQTQRDGSTVMSCDSKLLAHHLQIDITLSLQMLLKNVESQAQKISEQMSRRLVGSSVKPRVQEQETQIREELENEIEEDDGDLEIFVETADEEQIKAEQPLSQTKDSERDQEVNNSNTDQQDKRNILLFKHPKLQSLNYVGIRLKDSVIEFIEDFTKSGNTDREILMPDKHCSSSSFNKDGCVQSTNHWFDPSVEEGGSKQMDMLQIAQTLGIVEEGSWLKNTSSHVIATLIITCIQLSQWDSSEIPSTEGEPACTSVHNPLPDLTDSFCGSSPEPRLQMLLRSLLLDDDARLGHLASHLSHAMKDSSRHEPLSAWLLETTAALYWRGEGNCHHMVACLQAAVHKAPSELKDIPLHHVAHILLTLGHRHEALLLATLALKVSPRSINAHMVLFRTYHALGETENAMKYGKATLTLYEQSYGTPAP